MSIAEQISINDAMENDGVILRHMAIIMDGNGRWAKQRGLPRVAGHRRGVETVRSTVTYCGDRGIKYLTLFAFSSENWNRPRTEVKLLIELLHAALKNEIRRLHENNIRLRVIGDLSRFPQKLQKRIAEAEELTASNTTLNLSIALNYGGQWDMTQACQTIARDIEKGILKAEEVTDALIESRLVTHQLPSPDLFIRTGGECRISNFLLWQLAYTELYFIDTYWPDFDATNIDQAIEHFTNRERRFGKTGEQVRV